MRAKWISERRIVEVAAAAAVAVWKPLKFRYKADVRDERYVVIIIRNEGGCFISRKRISGDQWTNGKTAYPVYCEKNRRTTGTGARAEDDGK